MGSKVLPIALRKNPHIVKIKTFKKESFSVAILCSLYPCTNQRSKRTSYPHLSLLNKKYTPKEVEYLEIYFKTYINIFTLDNNNIVILNRFRKGPRDEYLNHINLLFIGKDDYDGYFFPITNLSGITNRQFQRKYPRKLYFCLK